MSKKARREAYHLPRGVVRRFVGLFKSNLD